jgi:hypothetical protein
MKESLYEQLKKSWQYITPVTKLLINIDYFFKNFLRKIQLLVKYNGTKFY